MASWSLSERAVAGGKSARVPCGPRSKPRNSWPNLAHWRTSGNIQGQIADFLDFAVDGLVCSPTQVADGTGDGAQLIRGLFEVFDHGAQIRAEVSM